MFIDRQIAEKLRVPYSTAEGQLERLLEAHYHPQGRVNKHS